MDASATIGETIMSRVRITRLQVKNYKGVEEFDYEVPAAGAIFAGKNGGGKTSLVDSLRAALGGIGIDASAIRVGAIASEIMVDMDDVSVRRVITQKGSTITVEDAGVLVKSPVGWLKNLLGTSAVDPIALFHADKKERRRLILGALPAKLSEQHLTEWLSDRYLDLPSAIRAKALAGHGLDGIAAVREFFYDARAEANKSTKALAAELAALEAEVAKLAPPEPPKPQGTLSLVGGKASPHKTKKAPPTKEEAYAALVALKSQQSGAHARIVEIEMRQKAALEQEARVSTTRALIRARRDDAKAFRDSAAEQPPYDPALAEAVLAAKVALEAAQEAFRAADERNMAALREKAEREKWIASAVELERGAAEMESAVGASSIEAPSQEDLAAAQTAAAEIMMAVTKAELGVQAADLHAKAEAKRAAVGASNFEADGLTVIVDRLSKNAPSQLIAESGGISGLDVTGENILLDGVAIDNLSGREQLLLAVEISKRANGGAKLLIVDGGERLDSEQRKAFVDACLKDDHQLIMTRVADGDVVVEALTVDEAAE